MPQNVNKILGYFCKKNCPQKLQNIARSGHTDTYERTYLSRDQFVRKFFPFFEIWKINPLNNNSIQRFLWQPNYDLKKLTKFEKVIFWEKFGVKRIRNLNYFDPLIYFCPFKILTLCSSFEQVQTDCCVVRVVVVVKWSLCSPSTLTIWVRIPLKSSIFL